MQRLAVPSESRVEILEQARKLVLTRGFNAFSFRDIAKLVDIKSSSVHYHFPSKEDLGLALIRRFAAELTEFVAEVEAENGDPLSRIRGFLVLFEGTAKSAGRVCLAGVLAGDVETLGEPLRAEVRAFFLHVENWLAGQIDQLGAAGRKPAAKRRPSAAARRQAAWILASLEGALVSARLHGEPQRVLDAVACVMEMLEQRR